MGGTWPIATQSGTSGLPVSSPVLANREQRRVALAGRRWTTASEINGSGVDWIGENASDGGLIPAQVPTGSGDLERAELFGYRFQARFLFQIAGKEVRDHRHLSGLQADPGGITWMHRIHPEAVRRMGPREQPSSLILLEPPPSHPLGD